MAVRARSKDADNLGLEKSLDLSMSRSAARPSASVKSLHLSMSRSAARPSASVKSRDSGSPHSIAAVAGERSGRASSAPRVSTTFNQNRPSFGSFVTTDTVSIDVGGCTDMHCYGIRTILYPYDPTGSTRGGTCARDTAQ